MRLKLGRPDLDAQPVRFDLPVAPRGHTDTPGLGVTFAGVSTLLFDDGETAVLFDGFFTRPSLRQVVLGRLQPNPTRIADALTRLGVTGETPLEVEAVVPVHSHFDHVLDSGHVAALTGAPLVGGTSTANVGRGAGLSEDQLRLVAHGDTITLGAWQLKFIASSHCPPDRYPGTIDAPVAVPARASAYRCGEAWSVLLRHHDGRSALIQGSAGYVPDALRDEQAQVAYLGVGQLGVQLDSYLHAYWHHTVETVNARQVVLTHWDDFFRNLDHPLRALPYAGDDLDLTTRTLGELATDQGRSISFPDLLVRQDPWATYARISA